jgi:transposase
VRHWAQSGRDRSQAQKVELLGLVPRQNSTGGKIRLGGITKRGNRYLPRLLINGASANLLRSKATKADPWVIGLRRRRPPLVVAVALANKTARIAWAVIRWDVAVHQPALGTMMNGGAHEP